MSTPLKCCGKPAKQILQRFASEGVVHSVLIYYACVGKCKQQMHLPFPPPKEGYNTETEEERERIYQAGIEFDNSLNGELLARFCQMPKNDPEKANLAGLLMKQFPSLKFAYF